MNAKIYGLIGLVLLLALPSVVAAQESNPFTGFVPEQLAETWLFRNCGIDDERFLELALLEQRRALKPLFRQAWQAGPSESSVADVRRAATARFQRNRSVLAEPEILGLSPPDIERAKARSAEEFATRAVSSFDTAYRSQALRGLFITGDAQERAMLEQVAVDSSSPFSDDARLILLRETPR